MATTATEGFQKYIVYNLILYVFVNHPDIIFYFKKYLYDKFKYVIFWGEKNYYHYFWGQELQCTLTVDTKNNFV